MGTLSAVASPGGSGTPLASAAGQNRPTESTKCPGSYYSPASPGSEEADPRSPRPSEACVGPPVHARRRGLPLFGLEVAPSDPASGPWNSWSDHGPSAPAWRTARQKCWLRVLEEYSAGRPRLGVALMDPCSPGCYCTGDCADSPPGSGHPSLWSLLRQPTTRLPSAQCPF